MLYIQDDMNIGNYNVPIKLNVTIDNPIYLRDAVKVENYTVSIEDGTFYLFEKSKNNLVLMEYPAFYFPAIQENGWKEFTVNTTIRNLNNQTIGFVVGHDMYYYPIAPRKNSVMYCGRYSLESLLGNSTYITFHNLEFTTYDFTQNFIELSNREKSCFIYI